MTFFDHLVELWNTPACDLSDTTTDPGFITRAKTALFMNNKAADAQLTIALEDAAKLKAAEDKGLENLTLSGLTITNGDGKVFKVQFDYGIPTVESIESDPPGRRIAELTFDETDNMDYNNRYVSMDAHIRDNDASDVAFFRIVKANDLKTLVFPKYDEYLMPGISKTKFRQFILLGLSEASQERMQIVETSEEFQLLFYGKRPEVLQIQGILKNTLDNPWNMNMLFLWDNLMRGTKLAEQGNILQLYADKQLYSGYPFGFQRSKAAPSDFVVNFSFSFIVTERLSSEDVKIKIDDSARIS